MHRWYIIWCAHINKPTTTTKNQYTTTNYDPEVWHKKFQTKKKGNQIDLLDGMILLPCVSYYSSVCLLSVYTGLEHHLIQYFITGNDVYA